MTPAPQPPQWSFPRKELIEPIWTRNRSKLLSPTVGDQLRAARKRKKLSLEDIAARTRIPLRHLESIEASDWEHLPAPTYSVGFAKSYAAVVDLDRTEIGDQLRAEMGSTRAVPSAPPEVFEPADPARTMPKSLVIRRDHRACWCWSG